jgi:hypothetical protein
MQCAKFCTLSSNPVPDPLLLQSLTITVIIVPVMTSPEAAISLSLLRHETRKKEIVTLISQQQRSRPGS